MRIAPHPSVYTIPLHRSFADALAAGLIARFGTSKIGLARGLVLAPSNRAVRTIIDAFVRRSGGGLLLPRIVAIGDEDLESQLGALDPLGPDETDSHVPPAIGAIERLVLLARLVQQHSANAMDAAEAFRLAEPLASTLDQLLIEEVDPLRLRDFASDLPELSTHWQKSLERLELILDAWPKLLAARGRIDLADRRNRILSRTAERWNHAPPPGFIVAAGIDTAAPAVARLLRTVAGLHDGMVVFSALDLAMPEEEWRLLGPHEADAVTGRRQRPIETHPQYHLKLLLDRMGVGRGEVGLWKWSGGRTSPAARTRAITNAMAPARYTGKWQSLAPTERRLSGIRALELADPAEEAQAIAIALREVLEKPGRTAALVTPDRKLARRVSAHLRRWNIEADDSAGRPLSQSPPGTLLLALISAASERFAPVPLLALLNHPLVRKGEERLAWLDGVRSLDLALRGPRPPAGLDGIGEGLARPETRGAEVRVKAATWWVSAQKLLEPLERAFQAQNPELGPLLDTLRETASQITDNEVWSGPAGRAAADLLAELEPVALHGPHGLDPANVAPLLTQLMERVAIRPPYGQHPRLFIWGLLEARLQHADLMILGGLNEGVWPALPTPDPWLAPRIRHELGLPSLERRIGLAAHDFATGLGARQILITRARRDARAPAIASRFWLRLEAMTGGVTRSPLHRRWARILDAPAEYRPVQQPAPNPPVAERPRRIAVTEVDRLKADPFAFYARKMLALAALDPIDADPSPAWRGSAVHRVLEIWMKEDDCDPDRLRARAEDLLAQSSAHPLMRALWQPRLLEAIDWIAEQVASNERDGRKPLKAEAYGSCTLAGVELYGIVDRIDRLADNSLAVVDYKTGRAPSGRAVHDGYAMQLGLLGVIAERGGFAEVEGVPSTFEYWSMAKDRGKLGYVASPTAGRNGIDPTEFTTLAVRNFVEAAEKWLTGNAPFTAKLHPEYAPYGDYDQLMRLDEWYGRERAPDR